MNAHHLKLVQIQPHQDGDTLEGMIGSLSGYDIYLGVHGAELTNVLYGNQGLVLVEVTSDGWDKVRWVDPRKTHTRDTSFEISRKIGFFRGDARACVRMRVFVLIHSQKLTSLWTPTARAQTKHVSGFRQSEGGARVPSTLFDSFRPLSSSLTCPRLCMCVCAALLPMFWTPVYAFHFVVAQRG